jgi:hypothetical protein
LNGVADMIPSLYGFGGVIQQTPPLARIIQPILPSAPIWALLIPPKVGFLFSGTNGGLRPDERRLPALAGGQSAYLLPLVITFNKEPVLQCVLSVVDPSPPVHLCAGVVGVDGAQVQDPACRFTMRLLAARRTASPGGHIAGQPSTTQGAR